MRSDAQLPRRHAHPIHLRLDDEQHRSLTDFASASGLTLTAALRLLLERALEAESSRPVDSVSARIVEELRTLTHAALGALIAAEHSRLAAVKFLGRHADWIEGLEEEATAAARARLIELERAELQL